MDGNCLKTWFPYLWGKQKFLHQGGKTGFPYLWGKQKFLHQGGKQGFHIYEVNRNSCTKGLKQGFHSTQDILYSDFFSSSVQILFEGFGKT